MTSLALVFHFLRERRLFSTVLLIVLVSAALPMILLRDRPAELGR